MMPVIAESLLIVGVRHRRRSPWRMPSPPRHLPLLWPQSEQLLIFDTVVAARALF
jgi:hypothetical protein